MTERVRVREIDDDELADVRAGTAEKQRSGGTGYLVGRLLVLTCRHVALDDDGQPWPRLEVRLGHPVEGPQRRTNAQVAWVHPDPARGAALLRVYGEPFTSGRLSDPDCPDAGRRGRIEGAMPADLTVILEHRPGELARLGESFGEAGVTIHGLAAFTGEGRGVVHMLLDNEAVAGCLAGAMRASPTPKAGQAA